MYERMTYENILQRMLDKMPENVDKREGSILYNALAPAGAELAMLYVELEVAWNEMFADTASREYLIRRAAERGMSPYPATHPIVKGIFTPASLELPDGTRFSGGEYDYTVVGRIAAGEYQLECETVGSAGNAASGELIPIDYIKGLETCNLAGLLIPGEDEEETEHFRKRYFDSLESQAFGGNIADYKEKVSAIQGVGGVKVYPAWQGGGTVKLVIINSNHQSPDPVLVQSVKEAIDPPENSGKGYGIAPIGHQVTVEAVRGVRVDLELLLVYQAGYRFELVKESIRDAVDAYFRELNQTWADSDCLVIRVSKLESRILDLPGILDVTGTMLNGDAKNLILGADEIAVRGEIHETGG